MRMFPTFTLLLLVVLCSLVGVSNGDLTPIEEQYLGIPSGARAYEHLAFYTARPHIAGAEIF